METRCELRWGTLPALVARLVCCVKDVVDAHEQVPPAGPESQHGEGLMRGGRGEGSVMSSTTLQGRDDNTP